MWHAVERMAKGLAKKSGAKRRDEIPLSSLENEKDEARKLNLPFCCGAIPASLHSFPTHLLQMRYEMGFHNRHIKSETLHQLQVGLCVGISSRLPVCTRSPSLCGLQKHTCFKGRPPQHHPSAYNIAAIYGRQSTSPREIRGWSKIPSVPLGNPGVGPKRPLTTTP